MSRPLSIYIYDDPFLSAKREAIKPHHEVVVVSSVENSPDGSGAWSGLHLNDAHHTFVQGGWLPKAQALELVNSSPLVRGPSSV